MRVRVCARARLCDIAVLRSQATQAVRTKPQYITQTLQPIVTQTKAAVRLTLLLASLCCATLTLALARCSPS